MKTREEQIDFIRLNGGRISAGRVGLRQIDAGNMIRATDANGLVIVTQMDPIGLVFSIPQERVAAGAIIATASHLGTPLSTTHVISTSIMGVGAMKRFSAVKWGLVQRIVWAWVLTLPITAVLGWLSARVMMLLGG